MAILGVSDHTAAIIMAEIGTNAVAFENGQTIATWASLCPGSYESDGKKCKKQTEAINTSKLHWLNQQCQRD
ncbi:transposase [Weissella cibaria]|uniref:transposase n=1 Tax=Weissella cibaria TaxID=137591 RepID=UPI00106E7BC2